MNLKSVEPHLHSSQTQQESVAIFTIQAGFVIITQMKSIFAALRLLHSFVHLFMVYKICTSIQPSSKSATSLAQYKVVLSFKIFRLLNGQLIKVRNNSNSELEILLMGHRKQVMWTHFELIQETGLHGPEPTGPGIDWSGT